MVSIDHPGCRFCGTLNLLIDLPMRSCVGFVTGVKLDEKRSTSDCDGMWPSVKRGNDGNVVYVNPIINPQCHKTIPNRGLWNWVYTMIYHDIPLFGIMYNGTWFVHGMVCWVCSVCIFLQMKVAWVRGGLGDQRPIIDGVGGAATFHQWVVNQRTLGHWVLHQRSVVPAAFA